MSWTNAAARVMTVVAGSACYVEVGLGVAVVGDEVGDGEIVGDGDGDGEIVVGDGLGDGVDGVGEGEGVRE